VLVHPLTTQISTIVKLNITYKPHSVIVWKQRNRLYCSAEGNPPPKITWQLLVNNGNSTTFDAKPYISVQNSRKWGYKYACHAGNYMGVAKLTVTNRQIWDHQLAIRTTLMGAILLASLGLILGLHVALKSTKQRSCCEREPHQTVTASSTQNSQQ
jgi:hypothetical protein